VIFLGVQIDDVALFGRLGDRMGLRPVLFLVIVLMTGATT